MNAVEKKVWYALDANVFIQAHRGYYAFDLCPGFWTALLHHHKAAQLVSIDKVKDELVGGDPLGQWVVDVVAEMFQSTQDADVAKCFGDMMVWVQGQNKYSAQAIADFANKADGWLAAFAMARGGTVVTLEKADTNAVKKIPLPNLCNQFAVPCIDTFKMLKTLKIKFPWLAS